MAKLLNRLFPLYIALTLLSIVFLAPVVQYACEYAPFASAGFLYVILALLIGFGFCWLYQNLKGGQKVAFFCNDKIFSVILAIAVCVLSLAQFLIVRGGWFKAGWDVGTLTDVGNIDGHLAYYSKYPNNWFLAALFYYIARLGVLLGQSETYLSLIAANCLCATGAAILASYAAKTANGYACGYATLLISSIFTALSPWILVPYSDLFSALFASSIIWAFVCLQKIYLKWPLITFLAIIGYQIKPTVLFVFVAVVAVNLWDKRDKLVRSLKRPLAVLTSSEFYKKALLVCLSALIAFGTTSYIKGGKFNNTDAEQAFSMAHFLMMGLNVETNGVWYVDDVAFSESFASREERSKANFEVVKERLEAYGPLTLAKLFIKKNLTNYNDGTMAWEIEGGFYVDTYGTSELIRNFYGIDDADTVTRDDNAFGPLYHLVWIFLLLGITLQLFASNQSSLNRVLMFSCILLSGFLMVFEARARYLLPMLPFYVILGLHGWLELSRCLNERR